jgi:hypothetical protein
MKQEGRKSRRRIVRHPATIINSDKSVLGPCTMVDVSATGAKIILKSGDQVSDEFLLSLSKSGNVTRQCKVSWRKDGVIGVEFIIGPLADKK